MDNNTRLIIVFQGEGDRSGGTFSTSGIKATGTTPDSLYQTALAINNLQAKAYRDIQVEYTTLVP